jgi:hypothetical protein
VPTVITISRHVNPDPSSSQLKVKSPPNKGCGTLEGLDGYVPFCLEDPINLSATGVHLLGHLRFADTFFEHLFTNLPGYDTRDA